MASIIPPGRVTEHQTNWRACWFPSGSPINRSRFARSGIKGYISYRALHELARWTYQETAAVPLRRVRWRPPTDIGADIRKRKAQNRGDSPGGVEEEPELPEVGFEHFVSPHNSWPNSGGMEASFVTMTRIVSKCARDNRYRADDGGGRLRVRRSSTIQYDNVRRAPIGPRFSQISHHQRPETPTKTGNLPADRPRVCGPGKHSGAPQRLIHSSHQPRPAPRLEPGATVSPQCGWAGPRSRPGGRRQDDVPARKAIVGGGQSATENSSAHDFAASSRRNPQRAGPRSARSTTPSRRRDQRLRERRRGDGR